MSVRLMRSVEDARGNDRWALLRADLPIIATSNPIFQSSFLAYFRDAFFSLLFVLLLFVLPRLLIKLCERWPLERSMLSSILVFGALSGSEGGLTCTTANGM